MIKGMKLAGLCALVSIGIGGAAGWFGYRAGHHSGMSEARNRIADYIQDEAQQCLNTAGFDLGVRSPRLPCKYESPDGEIKYADLSVLYVVRTAQRRCHLFDKEDIPRQALRNAYCGQILTKLSQWVMQEELQIQCPVESNFAEFRD
ncbi:hypothetical protein HY486_03365 [Candidatus Woesearchaeota archaeon]|nr:hypothetical protein [Candidatus Woesearchaeota archaeon]